MKQYLSFVTALIIAVSSCQSKSNTELIVGTWQLSFGIMETNFEITYYKDKTFKVQQHNNGVTEQIENGTYSLINDGAVIRSESQEKGSQELEIVILNLNTMKLKSATGITTFKRISN